MEKDARRIAKKTTVEENIAEKPAGENATAVELNQSAVSSSGLFNHFSQVPLFFILLHALKFFFLLFRSLKMEVILRFSSQPTRLF